MKFLINSHVNNKKAVDLLFRSLRRCEEFDQHQFIVCMGGHEPIDTYEHTTKDNITTILCGHNSIDFTALVTAIDYDAPDLFSNDDHYFYMHDTCIAGTHFLKIIQERTKEHAVGIKLLGTGSKSKNIGLYSHELLVANTKFLLTRAKNTDYSNIDYYKYYGFRWEDIIFKSRKNDIDCYSDVMGDHRQHLRHGYFAYFGDIYNNSTTRAVTYFNDLDFYKTQVNCNRVVNIFTGESLQTGKAQTIHGDEYTHIIDQTDNNKDYDTTILDTIYDCGERVNISHHLRNCEDIISNKKLVLLLRGHIKHTLDQDNIKKIIMSLGTIYDLHVYICTWDCQYQDEFWAEQFKGKIPSIYSEDIKNSKHNNNLVTEEIVQEKLGKECMQYVREIQIFNQDQVDQQLVGDTDGFILRGKCKKKGWKRMWYQINHGLETIDDKHTGDTMIVNMRLDLIETSQKLKDIFGRRMRPVVDPIGFINHVMNRDLRVNNNIHVCRESIGGDNIYLSSVDAMKTITYWFAYHLDSILKTAPSNIKSQELLLKIAIKNKINSKINEIDQQTI